MDNLIIGYQSSEDTSIKIIHPNKEMYDPTSKLRLLLKEYNIIFSTDEEVLQFIINEQVPPNTQYSLLKTSDLPNHRFFRDAWTLDNNEIKTDLPKAINIKKDQLRRLRKPLLEKLDIEFTRALETNDTDKLELIKNKKQQLRDITAIPLPTDNLDLLKDFIPDILNS